MIILTNEEFRKLNNKCFMYKIQWGCATERANSSLNLAIEIFDNAVLIHETFQQELELNLEHQF